MQLQLLILEIKIYKNKVTFFIFAGNFINIFDQSRVDGYLQYLLPTQASGVFSRKNKTLGSNSAPAPLLMQNLYSIDLNDMTKLDLSVFIFRHIYKFMTHAVFLC